jgi:hypothetical protein
MRSIGTYSRLMAYCIVTIWWKLPQFHTNPLHSRADGEIHLQFRTNYLLEGTEVENS